MRKLYIGISGKMGSGKTTLSSGIISLLSSMNIQRVSMAEPIKRVQDLIYKDLDIEMVGEKDRPLLIALGMWGRDRSSVFWLDQAVKKFEQSKAEVIICDDVRFENEAEWFQKNGVLIRLTGEQRGSNVTESVKMHMTETALDNYPFENIIENNQIEFTLQSAMYIIASYLNLEKQIVRGVIGSYKEGA